MPLTYLSTHLTRFMFREALISRSIVRSHFRAPKISCCNNMFLLSYSVNDSAVAIGTAYLPSVFRDGAQKRSRPAKATTQSIFRHLVLLIKLTLTYLKAGALHVNLAYFGTTGIVGKTL